MEVYINEAEECNENVNKIETLDEKQGDIDILNPDSDKYIHETALVETFTNINSFNDKIDAYEQRKNFFSTFNKDTTYETTNEFFKDLYKIQEDIQKYMMDISICIYKVTELQEEMKLPANKDDIPLQIFEYIKNASDLFYSETAFIPIPDEWYSAQLTYSDKSSLPTYDKENLKTAVGNIMKLKGQPSAINNEIIEMTLKYDYDKKNLLKDTRDICKDKKDFIEVYVTFISGVNRNIKAYETIVEKKRTAMKMYNNGDFDVAEKDAVIKNLYILKSLANQMVNDSENVFTCAKYAIIKLDELTKYEHLRLIFEIFTDENFEDIPPFDFFDQAKLFVEKLEEKKITLDETESPKKEIITFFKSYIEIKSDIRLYIVDIDIENKSIKEEVSKNICR